MFKPKRCLPLLAASVMMAAPAVALEDGVYRDQAEGYNGKVIVTAIVRGGKWESIETENTGGEKSEYYQKAEKELIPAIIAAGGTDGVDAVAGATGTSESILNAMKGIEEQAQYTGAPLGMLNQMAEDAKDKVKDGAEKVMDGAETIVQDAADGAQNAVDDLKNAADDTVNSVKEPTLTADPKPTV